LVRIAAAALNSYINFKTPSWLVSDAFITR
jgi:hypothetical protein